MVTSGIIEKREWQGYSPASIRGFVYDDRYYGFYEDGGDDSNEDGGFIFDMSEPTAVFTLTGVAATAGHRVLENDDLFVMVGGVLRQFDEGGSEEQTYWKSKAFILPRPAAMTAAKVRFTSTGGVTESEYTASLEAAMSTIDQQIANDTIVSNGSLGGFSLAAYTVAGGPYLAEVNDLENSITGVTLLVYADGTLIHTEVVSDEKPFRMPGGYLTDVYEFELSGNNVSIHEVVMAETMSELAGL